MSNCRTGCATRDHASYSACLRAAAIKVAYCNSAGGQDFTKQKAWDKELDAYQAARAEGIQPATTQMKSIEAAKAISDATGSAYEA